MEAGDRQVDDCVVRLQVYTLRFMLDVDEVDLGYCGTGTVSVYGTASF